MERVEEERPGAMRVELTAKRFAYFPTLVFRFQVLGAQALNDRLLSLIHSEREKDQEGIERSNYRELGGWHSRDSLHKAPEYREFTDLVYAACAWWSRDLGYHPSYSLRIGTMWSIVNPPGASNLAHVHPGCLWSGVYYVQAPANSGKIAFTDPRTENVMRKARYVPNQSAPRHCWTKVNFTPEPGMMLVFPSWLYHSVAPNLSQENDGKCERIIISFNLSQWKD